VRSICTARQQLVKCYLEQEEKKVRVTWEIKDASESSSPSSAKNLNTIITQCTQLLSSIFTLFIINIECLMFVYSAEEDQRAGR